MNCLAFKKNIFILLLFFLLKTSNLHSQTDSNTIEFRIRNDDAGEVSNWLKTGDDLGETQACLIAINFLKKHPKYNYRIKIESTEFSALDNSTVEPRDIVFNELNNFQLSFDNNKLKTKTFFYSLSAGLYYIQSNHITIGATGQKEFWHKYILSNFYPKKNWIYNSSNIPDAYFPYAELKYGYVKDFFESNRFSLQTNANLELQLSTNSNFNGVAGKTSANFRFKNDRFRMHEFDVNFESFYQTNIAEYQIAYCQGGLRLNFKHFATYSEVCKPIKKNLNNPFIKYNDMEILFNYGIIIFFK